jgi:hypothetical protein
MKLQNSTIDQPSTPSQPVCRGNFAHRSADSRAAFANDGHNRAVRSADCVLNSLFREIVFPVPGKKLP